MDLRIYEKGSSDDRLWATLVAVMFGLGLVWMISSS
jgi:hypothetical protein